ncbi:hypothetical protein D3C86_1824080 [compost metagenome]
MRDDEADKADRPRKRHCAAGKQDDGDDRHPAPEGRILPDRARGIRAKAQRRQMPTEEKRDDEAKGNIGRDSCCLRHGSARH